MSNIERSNIQYRLNSGRQQYINRGGKLVRRKGSVKTVEQRKEEYREVISLLKRGYSIRNVARLTGFSIQTVQTSENPIRKYLKQDENGRKVRFSFFSDYRR